MNTKLLNRPMMRIDANSSITYSLFKTSSKVLSKHLSHNGPIVSQWLHILKAKTIKFAPWVDRLTFVLR